MKEKQADATACGVIVARFQLHELHDAHRDLIQSVIDRHERVIVFLGLSPLKNTVNNPLEFKQRKAMIEEAFKGCPKTIEIHYVDDNRDDHVWSKNLDKQLTKWLNPGQSATLYGSRDSFLKCYHGKYPVCELESDYFVSATDIRRKIVNNYPPTKDFRAGLIAATGMKYPTAFQTVDVAIVNERREVLMVKKPGEMQWRFVGGFSDPRSESLEHDVRREVMEETQVEIGGILYIGSTIIDDWRYRHEVDKIKTAFFVAKYLYGRPQGADDVEVAAWINIDDLIKNQDIVPEHKVLLKMFIEKVLTDDLVVKRFLTITPAIEPLDADVNVFSRMT
jgi:bifunctional NMN adenylyltransferase/nudix hydrolase